MGSRTKPRCWRLPQIINMFSYSLIRYNFIRRGWHIYFRIRQCSSSCQHIQFRDSFCTNSLRSDEDAMNCHGTLPYLDKLLFLKHFSNIFLLNVEHVRTSPEFANQDSVSLMRHASLRFLRIISQIFFKCWIFLLWVLRKRYNEWLVMSSTMIP
jgi:hypothetical protein